MATWYDMLLAVLLGTVQGITEFLPISSSGHLLLLHEFFNFATDQALTFDIALHAGTLLSIVLFFAKDLWRYTTTQPKLLLQALVSCLPAGLVGWLFGDAIEHWLRSSWVVVVMLVLVSIVFLLVEGLVKPTGQLHRLTWRQAMAMGVAQAVALIPGTSRSGITLITGMWFGLQRVEAAKFSFIMTIPLLLALTAKQGMKLVAQPLASHDLLLMAIGAGVAAGVGMLAIRFLLQFFKTATLRPFAYYRLGLAAVVSLLLLL